MKVSIIESTMAGSGIPSGRSPRRSCWIFSGCRTIRRDARDPEYDFTSSGLTNSHAGWAAAVNTHRVSKVAYAEPTFGLIEIDWDAPISTLSLQARSVAGDTAFEVRVQRDELRVEN